MVAETFFIQEKDIRKMAENNSKSVNQEYAELYDVPRMTIGEIKEEIKLNYNMRLFRGIYCIVGEAGLGKSQVVHQVARELKARVCDIRTAQFGLLSAGVPSIRDAEEGFFRIKVPTGLPRKGERCILAFDEINQGAQHAIAMFYSLAEDRFLYDYELSDDCLIVAMMNPSTGSYVVNQIENNAALRRRLRFVYAIYSPDEWLQHARTREFHYSDRTSPVIPENGLSCHEHVRSFIATAPTMLYDEQNKKNNRPFACPATWQTISLDCYALESADISLQSSRALSRFGSSLNLTMASQFQAFIEDNNVILSPVEFLTDTKHFMRKFQQLEDLGKQPRLVEFVYNLLNYMFDVEYDIDKAYPAIFTFFETCAAEYAALFTDNITPTANQYGKPTYRANLINSFVKDKDRFRAHLKHSEKAHDAVDRFVRLNN
jgi:hypothetical protein